MQLKFPLRHRVTTIVLVPFFVQIALLLLFASCMRQAEDLAEKEYRSRNIIGHANWLTTLASTAALSLTSYVYSKQSLYLTNYKTEVSDIYKEIYTLSQLVKGDVQAVQNNSSLATATQKYIQQLTTIEQQARLNNDTSLNQFTSPTFTRALSDVLRARNLLLTVRMNEVEEPQVVSNRRKGTEAFIGFGILFNITSMLLLLCVFTKNIALRLEVLTDNTVRLSRMEPLNPVTEGNDEIAHLDQVFHRVAEALVASTKRERAVLENAAEVICSFDSFGRIVEINHACLPSWGYEPEELIGKYFLELVSPREQEHTATQLAQGARNHERFSFDNEITRKDGTVVIIRWTVYWSAQEKTYFCVAHDITHDKYIEQLKAQFVNMVSHDLRTPLASISSFIELIMSGAFGELPGQCTHAASMAQRSSRRLINLTNDLLDLERLESGAFPLEPVAVDIKDVIEEALSSLEQFAQDAQVIIDHTGVINQVVTVDGPRITQVIVNLLSNAVKFSPPNSVVIIIATLRMSNLEVSIIDMGRGVPHHLKGILFDRFKQVEVRDAKRGSGLGLAISKAIIEQHNGKIGVDSQLGLGSRFWFSIPIERTHNVLDFTPESAAHIRELPQPSQTLSTA